MTALCLAAAGAGLRFAAGLLTLAWTHSIEKVEWRETWRATPAGLELVEARVRGSGAGMEPGDDARLENGFWVWHPHRPPLPRLVLARSGATADWRICDIDACRPLGVLLDRPMDGGTAEILPCP